MSHEIGTREEVLYAEEPSWLTIWRISLPSGRVLIPYISMMIELVTRSSLLKRTLLRCFDQRPAMKPPSAMAPPITGSMPFTGDDTPDGGQSWGVARELEEAHQACEYQEVVLWKGDLEQQREQRKRIYDHRRSREELVSGRTHREARRVAIYLALQITKLSFVQIAKRVGGISWKNVVVGARTIEHRMGEDPKFAAEVVDGIKTSLLDRR
jgi:hypothetical protein